MPEQTNNLPVKINPQSANSNESPKTSSNNAGLSGWWWIVFLIAFYAITGLINGN